MSSYMFLHCIRMRPRFFSACTLPDDANFDNKITARMKSHPHRNRDAFYRLEWIGNPSEVLRKRYFVIFLFLTMPYQIKQPTTNNPKIFGQFLPLPALPDLSLSFATCSKSQNAFIIGLFGSMRDIFQLNHPRFKWQPTQ